MNASPNEAMSKVMTVWMGVNLSATMSLIVGQADSVMINMRVRINSNGSSCLGMIRNEDGFQVEFKRQ